jgi:diaminohydroxyphosphoribosylaminopyrimidine deaminase / 5-amino-6-(5-phosphoribosylamino)uracil reductase
VLPNTEELMRKTLEVAQLGWPAVAPNPMVGALVLHNDRIVTKGYHKKFGEPHAEVMALTYIPADIDPSECTLFVSLEPCNHQGKTPPCTELIINTGIKKVVISALDPNPLVSGKGIARLKEAGIEVEQGVLEAESRIQNRRFITFHEKKRPYILLKWAMSRDGFISRLPVPKRHSNNLISGPEAHRYAHTLRAESMAVMVGKQTVLSDNPELTVRMVKGKNPLRVCIDKNLELPKHSSVFNNKAKTLVFNQKKTLSLNNLLYVQIDFEKDVLDQILAVLYKMGIQSLLVEGGTRLINSFLKKDLYDEVVVIENPGLILNSGIKAPDFEMKGLEVQNVGNDLLYHHLRFF